MFAYFKQQHPSTVVEHCLEGRFTDPDEDQLIVAKVNVLEVYRIAFPHHRHHHHHHQQQQQHHDGEHSEQHGVLSEPPVPAAWVQTYYGYSSSSSSSQPPQAKLELLHSFTLFGNIECMAKTRFAYCKRDSLILAFQEAKFAVLDFDPSANDLKTISLHSYEDLDAKDARDSLGNTYLPQIRVDPFNQCAAFLVYGRKLFVLPFNHEVNYLDEDDIYLSSASSLSKASFPSAVGPAAADKRKKSSSSADDMAGAPSDAGAAGAGSASRSTSRKRQRVRPSYEVELVAVNKHINSVLDLQFLNGYFEPTLALLYETVPTWTGRVAMRKDTCQIAVLSLNTSQHTHPVIWSAEKLPYNIMFISPVPKPIGGILLVTPDALIHINQSIAPFGVSLNECSDASTDMKLVPVDGVVLDFNFSRHCFLNEDTILFSLQSGDLHIVRIVSDGRAVVNFRFEKAATSVIPFCITMIGQSFFFIGSRVGDSVLIEILDKAASTPAPQSVKRRLSDAETGAGGAEKRSRTDPGDSDDNDRIDVDHVDHVDDELDSLYSSAPAADKSRSSSSLSSAKGGSTYDELDELFASAPVSRASSKKTAVLYMSSHTFRVCDSLLNTGPVGKMTVGLPENISAYLHESVIAQRYQRQLEDETFLHQKLPASKELAEVGLLDLVCTAGCGKNGAIVVTHRGIRPDITSSFDELAGKLVWTVYGSEKATSAHASSPPLHSLMVVSTLESTMVLAVSGEEIEQVEESGFHLNGPTVMVGNVFLSSGEALVVQVFPRGLRLLQGTTLLQDVPLEADLVVHHASICSPYVLLHVENSSPLLAVLDAPTKRLSLVSSEFAEGPEIVASCLYTDRAGVLLSESDACRLFPSKFSNAHILRGSQQSGDKTRKAKRGPAGGVIDADEDMDFLYGSTKSEKSVASSAEPAGRGAAKENETVHSSASDPAAAQQGPTFWCVIVRSNGILEIYRLPDFKLLFLISNFSLYPSILASESSVQAFFAPSADDPVVTDVMLANLDGPLGSRPYLIATLSTEDLLVYEAFQYVRSDSEVVASATVAFPETSDGDDEQENKRISTSEQLSIRFKRAVLPSEAREPAGISKRREQSGLTQKLGLGRIVAFHGIQNGQQYISGVFVCGYRPMWLFMSPTRKALRCHTMLCDGFVSSFSAFNIPSCGGGFAYFTESGALRICQLSADFNHDNYWPVRKIPVRLNVHSIAYHEASRTYVMVTSKATPYTMQARISNEEVYQYEPLTKGPRFILPLVDNFSLHLVSPVSWEVVHSFDFPVFERVSSCAIVSLISQETVSGFKDYVSVGTTIVQGEDVTCYGRILLFEVIDVVPEPGKPQSNHKLKFLIEKEQKGSITAVTHTKGYLLTCIGQKIIVWTFKNNEALDGVAFIDTQIYIVSVSSLKNFVLIGDINNSVYLLRFNDSTKHLGFVAKDFDRMNTYATQYVVDGPTLGFLATDSMQNLSMFIYDPLNRESFAGQRLLRRLDFHIGSHVNTIVRLVCQPLPAALDEGASLRRHVNVLGTTDGALDTLAPLPETTFRRLDWLQRQLVGLSQRAGLNPVAYRAFKFYRKTLSSRVGNVIDGELLSRFMYLGLAEQRELAKQRRNTPEDIINDIVTAHFVSHVL